VAHNEGPKGISNEVENAKGQDKDATPLPSRSKLEEKREDEKEKQSKTILPKPYMPPLPLFTKICEG